MNSKKPPNLCAILRKAMNKIRPDIRKEVLPEKIFAVVATPYFSAHHVPLIILQVKAGLGL